MVKKSPAAYGTKAFVVLPGGQRENLFSITQKNAVVFRRGSGAAPIPCVKTAPAAFTLKHIADN